MEIINKDNRQGVRTIDANVSISLRPLDPKVWFRFWNGSECNIRDISIMGVGVFTTENIPIGTPLSIDLRLGKDKSTIRIFGKVEWIADHENKFRTGVSFSWWKDDQDKKIVTEYLSNQINAVN